MAHYIHNVPGRLRVTIPALKGRADRCREVQGLLCEMDGIANASVNSITGSVVVRYSAEKIGQDELLSLLEGKGYFNPAVAARNRMETGKGAEKAGVAICRAALGWAVGKALEGNGLSFLAAFI